MSKTSSSPLVGASASPQAPQNPQGPKKTQSPQNPWVDEGVHLSSEQRREQFDKRFLPNEHKSSARRSCRSSRSSRSSRTTASSAVSARKLDAVADAAALKVKLRHLDEEVKRKAELEQKKAELERFQAMKDLDIAEAQIKAITDLELDSDSSSSSQRSPPSVPDCDNDYVQQYVESLPTPVAPPAQVYLSYPDDQPPEEDCKPRVKLAVDYMPSKQPAVDPKLHVKNNKVPQPGMQPPVGPKSCVNTSKDPQPWMVSAASAPLNPNCESFTPASNEVLRSLAQQLSIVKLPNPEPGVFDGNPLGYPMWKAAFEVLVETRQIKPAEKLYFLKRYVAGNAKEAIDGYFMVPSENAYEEARKLLDKRYGNPFTVANAFREKLESWQRIPNKDGVALRKFGDFLRQCNAAMSQNENLNVLNDPHENQKMLMKLPDWLVLRWNRIVSTYRLQGQFPKFQEFVNFIEAEAEIACNPVSSLQSLKKTQKVEAAPSRSDVKRTSFSTEVSKCSLCDQDHHISICAKFLKKTLGDRKEYIKKGGLCYGCLNKGHRSKFCKQRAECKDCGKRHPTCLHGDKRVEKSKEKGDLKDAKEGEGSQKEAVSHSSHLNENVSKNSMIVPVWLSHVSKPESERLVYALLDTQSDTTFALESSVEALGVDGPCVDLILSTMTAKDKVVKSRKIAGLQVRGYDSELKLPLPMVYSRQVMPANRSHIPTPETAIKWPHLKKIAGKLMPLTDCEIGLLIGYNCSRALAPREVILPDSESYGPFGQKTDLGWGIVGIVDHSEIDKEGRDPIGVSHHVVTCESPPSLSKVADSQISFRSSVKEIITPYQVCQMMELDFSERTNDQRTLSQEDRQFMNIVHDGIHLREDHHYEMPLPFKESKSVQLPNNRAQAWHRLMQLKSRMQRQTKYKADYTKFMQGIIDNEYAELVPRDQLDSTNVWYVPHHGVYHARKTDKLRVVFDCSARTHGVALNDLLLQGPDLTNALTGVLTRFRLEHIAVICDIEQMFFQFHVNTEHRDYLRFFWWEDGNLDKEPVEYRMTVHLFGAISSPGCANFGLKQVAKDNEDKFGPAAARFICDNFYVDDGLISVPTATEAVALIQNTKEMCQKGGLRLHKFVSNSKEVMATVPPADRAEGIKDLDLLKDDLPIERALGIQWCIETDTFQFRIILKDQPLTRRGILSTISSIYDPLGFISPVMLVGKQILQQLCKDGADWDSPVSDALRTQWSRWRNNLFQLEELKIQRCVKPEEFENVKGIELHHFSDASSSGYGQCSYLRLIDDQERVHCSLLMGKSRVTPLKSVTIPRLELNAAVVSVKVSSLLKRELKFEQIEEVFWTDSRVVLGYISNESRRFHVFVANRVQQIRDQTKPTQWRFVKTDENPADDASRGISVYDLIHKSMWLTGPDFLWKRELPEQVCANGDASVLDGDPEVKRSAPLATCVDRFPQHFELQRLEYFSDWNRVRRAVANCIKFKDLLRNRVKKKVQTVKQLDDTSTHKIQPIVVEDLRQAEREIIRMVQLQTFPEEMKVLTSLRVHKDTPDRINARKRNQAIKKTSSLYRLDPFLDSEGLMRVGGRIRRAEFSLEFKHPVILPRRHHITTLLIRHHHENVKHQGRGMTTNALRASGYWIIGCSGAVSRVIHECVNCRRLRRPCQEQKMADLPEDRVEPVPPFTYSAVDYFGPFKIKEGRSEHKRYGVLFTCLTCRAIHIETANALSTDSFINALRRFLAIRGPIRQLRSDCGTNFVGAKGELQTPFANMDSEAIKNFLLKENCDFIEFKMNVPSSSHMGGSWERQIRTVRSVLASVMSKADARLDDESLRTLMSEASAIVNCRPLTVDNLNDPELEPLTPNHLLTMKSSVVLPPCGEFEQTDLYCRKRWRRVQLLADEFWKRWKNEYLTSLQTRQKWEYPQRDLHEGDIVIVKDDDLPRNRWLLARVEETYPSDDGRVRKVKVKLADKYYDTAGKRTHSSTYLVRPIHKLVMFLENP